MDDHRERSHGPSEDLIMKDDSRMPAESGAENWRSCRDDWCAGVIGRVAS